MKLSLYYVVVYVLIANQYVNAFSGNFLSYDE